MTKLLKKIATIGITLFVLCMPVTFAQTEDWPIVNDYTTYFFTTDKMVKLSWGAAEHAVSYDIRAYNIERKEYVSFISVSTQETTIQLPRSGHYVIEVRGVSSTGKVGDWVQSVDSQYSVVDLNAKGWWLYGHVAKPGEIIIN